VFIAPALWLAVAVALPAASTFPGGVAKKLVMNSRKGRLGALN
jgi:hypothetical protein